MPCGKCQTPGCRQCFPAKIILAREEGPHPVPATRSPGLVLYWRDEATLVAEVGPVHAVIAHVMDGEVHIYNWHDPDGDDLNKSLAYITPCQGRKLLRAIFAEYGCVVPACGFGDDGRPGTGP